VAARRKKGRRRTSSRPRPAEGSDAPAKGRGAAYRQLAFVAALFGAALAAFAITRTVSWLVVPRRGGGNTVEVAWPADDRRAGTDTLAAAGVVDHPALFRALLTVTGPLLTLAPGPHLLRDDLTPVEVLRRLARLSSRARVRAVLPEGFNRFQIAARLEELGVCSARTFKAASTDPVALAKLGVTGGSAEGYLFPATYDLFADSAADAVVAELAIEAKKRLAALRAAHLDAFARLEQRYGWDEAGVLTLASIVEKESGRVEEQPLIASVFFNRLDDADFRPPKSLQSDPTAAYGCMVAPMLESCRDYTGRVTPAMVRDSENPYNTYRHPGLPPGPIANPGARAIEAVLAPASTDFLFFVRSGEGRHVFTRTFEEHQAAMGGTRANGKN
jgi:UPF0755 protein